MTYFRKLMISRLPTNGLLDRYWYSKEILGFERRIPAHLFTIPAFFLITFHSFFLLFTFRPLLVRPASEKSLKLWFRKFKKKVFNTNLKGSHTRAASILYLYRGRRLRRGRLLSSPSPDSSRCSSFLPSSDWSPDSLSRGGGGRRRRRAQGGSSRNGLIPYRWLGRKIFFCPINEDVLSGNSVAFLHEVVFFIDLVLWPVQPWSNGAW